MFRTEAQYQSHVVKRVKSIIPSSVVLKNDPEYLPGIPDLSILAPYSFWAMLEVKLNAHTLHRPNQDYYIEILDSMSFAAFIYPEVEEEVLSALQSAYESCRQARIPQPQ